MSGRRGPRTALALVRLASRLVPGHEREAWRREWEAELWGRWHDARAGRPALRGQTGLARRALGSFVDAGRLRARHGVPRGGAADVRIAIRNLARRPLFSGLVMATLALGIGANATLFSVARDQLLRPFPYPDPDRVVALVGLTDGRAGFSGNVSYPNVADLDAAATTFTDIGLIRYWTPALTGASESVVLRGGTVTANFFDILGMEPGAGRYFRPAEQGTGRDPQVVLSHAFWQARFGADPSLIGRDLLLNGTAYRVIGVTPPDFEDPWLLDGPGSQPQVWRTLASPPSEGYRSGRNAKGLGRVRDGVALSVAQDELSALMAGLVEAYPEENANRRMIIVPLRDRTAGPVRPAILTLAGAVGLLLLVATANLASLLLGRALERQREFVMLRALGASGWRIVRAGLVEALVLAAAGGVAGLVVTLLSTRALATVGTTFLPRPLGAGLDLQVVGFACAATLGSALLFGLIPSVHAARVGTGLPGRVDGERATASRQGNRLRRGLVIAQLALTTVLLVGSGLLVRSLNRLGRVDLGMETEGVLSVELHGSAWWELSPEEAQVQWDAVLAAVRAVRGVSSAGAIDYVPLGGGYSCDGVYRADRPPPEPGEGMCGEVRVVLPGALQTLGVPLVRGRAFGPEDRADAPGTVVVDQSLARALWPDEDPMDGVIRVHGNTHRVIGVVEDMLPFGPGQDSRPMLYLHAPQEGWNGVARGLSLLVRSGREPGAVVAAVRDAVRSVNPTIATGPVATLDHLLGETLAAPRFRALLLSLFAGSALLLALLGIAGVMAFSVARRTRELGVRLALGARPDEVCGLVLAEGARLTGLGVAVGLAAALPAGRVLENLLYEIRAWDPPTLVVVMALIITAALLCCSIPARRAARVDPVSALAAE